jgi:phosphohistidine phosphatase
MDVHLVRHGRAVETSFAYDDSTRWLSQAGREAALRCFAKLRDQGVVFDAIVTSPFTRAVQTAELLARSVGYEGAIEALELLRPDGYPQRAAEDIAARGTVVAVVSHEPFVSALCRHLGGADASFRTGEVRMIRDGALAWKLDPETLSFYR